MATRNLISGTTHLMGAALSFLELAFGAALGGKLSVLLLGPLPPSAPPDALPGWTLVPAIVIASLSLVVPFRARARDAGWTVLSGAVAFLGARIGTTQLGPELGAFTGAFLLGAVSNRIAVAFDRPAVVTAVPGLLLLVPGSLGFRSLESLLDRDVVEGVGAAFAMSLVAVAIAAGLLLANAIVPQRNNL